MFRYYLVYAYQFLFIIIISETIFEYYCGIERVDPFELEFHRRIILSIQYCSMSGFFSFLYTTAFSGNDDGGG